MGIKKRSKVSAEFSMSSLTDIIFLLLIFFMLTSSLVAPNALNLKLPGKSTNRPPSAIDLDDVRIDSQGRYFLNGRSQSLSALDAALRSKAKGQVRKVSVTISPATGAPVEAVVAVMDIAMRYNINGILATELD